MGQLDGWTNWSVAYFRKIFFAGEEIVFDFPTRIRFPKTGQANSIKMLAGTNVHQPFWFGGDATINLQDMSPIEIDFQPDSENEYMKMSRYGSLCSFDPQAFFAGIWIPDIWYIPGAASGQTIWQLSRSLPFDIIDINDPTNDYLPKAFIDDTPQTIIQVGSPMAAQVKITPDIESAVIETPVLAAGTFLRLEYPAKFYICKCDSNEEIPDTDVFTMGLSMQEHLPNRTYNITIP